MEFKIFRDQNVLGAFPNILQLHKGLLEYNKNTELLKVPCYETLTRWFKKSTSKVMLDENENVLVIRKIIKVEE